LTGHPTHAILSKSVKEVQVVDFINDYQTVMDKTIEALIDKLHSLASEGRLGEAKEIADRIKQMQRSAA